ncbi:hypothetical protein NC796_00400 [Aliifodinibius sp. S!AR15-10]|uniref:hypothetical protein n=1 Tax=Aliifodinibius sp. S!AR15-10 TaxID=2950437 RepID=UPI00285C87CB|nr:hypothetical protein [Aliifodinibius sp. S!AR15-10]MDR8389573.1 hypothetical protein [Aliifodinibius sp. S!AR15-10]
MAFLNIKNLNTFLVAFIGAFLWPLINYLFFGGTIDAIDAVKESFWIAVLITVVIVVTKRILYGKQTATE